MNTGQIISGIGHAGLIGWALLGGMFRSEPLPFEVTEVTTITSEEFAALTSGAEAPETVTEVAMPTPPEPDVTEPEMPEPEAAAPVVEQPQVAETPPPDDRPKPPELTVPQAEVSDDVAVLVPPVPEVPQVNAPETSVRPQPRPAPRVAPEPVAQPEPDVRVDEVVREETAPSEDATEALPEEEASAPEEATTEIVTEAEKLAAAAPTTSLRPKGRPARPEPADEPSEEAAPATDNAAINDALAAALGEASDTPAPAAPSGPPLTGGEQDALRIAVQACWNVGSLSSEALRTTVTVGVSLSQDGRPDANSIKMLGYEGGSASAAEQAYQAARRAIVRCGNGGFPLPPEKYDHWRDIEMIFNPERMRFK